MSETKTNTIGKEFTMVELLKFVAAPVLSKLFIALLSTLDDGLFIARYCSENALAAFSIAMPWFMLVDAFGMLLSATGIKCSMLMGEKKNDEANASFSAMYILTFFIGCIFTLILTFFRKQILIALNATDVLLPYALDYMNVSRFYTPLVLLSYLSSRFYTIAGKPKMAVFTTVWSTFCNFFFDWVFIVKLNTGIVGTAYANLIGNVTSTIIALIFFSNKKAEVHFVKPDIRIWPLFKEVCKLGKAMFLTSLALSINSYIANSVLLNYTSEIGVAAYTIVNNVQFMFMNAFFGLGGATSPIASYAYGEKNVRKLSRILKQILMLMTGLGIMIFIAFKLLRDSVIDLYLINSTNESLKEMVQHGMRVVPYAFLIFGYNFMVQDLAVSVGNDKTSAILSAIENIIMSNATIILLPMIFGTEGIWYAFLVQEAVTLLFSAYTVFANRDVYGYGPKGIATFTQH